MSVTLPFSTTVACAKTLQSVSIGVSFGPGLTNTVWGSSILVITAVWKRQWNKLRWQMAQCKHGKTSFLRCNHIYSSNPFFPLFLGTSLFRKHLHTVTLQWVVFIYDPDEVFSDTFQAEKVKEVKIVIVFVHPLHFLSLQDFNFNSPGKCTL